MGKISVFYLAGVVISQSKVLIHYRDQEPDSHNLCGHLEQCDQMAKIFFNICPFKRM